MDCILIWHLGGQTGCVPFCTKICSYMPLIPSDDFKVIQYPNNIWSGTFLQFMSTLVLTQYNSQHLCGFLLSGLSVPVAALVVVPWDPSGPNCGASVSVRHLLHLTSPHSRLLFFLPRLFVTVGLGFGACKGGLADAAVVRRVHRGKDGVIDGDRFRSFTA